MPGAHPANQESPRREIAFWARLAPSSCPLQSTIMIVSCLILQDLNIIWTIYFLSSSSHMEYEKKNIY